MPYTTCRTVCSVISLGLLSCAPSHPEHTSSTNRWLGPSAPEREGIDSRQLSELVRELHDSGERVHSLTIARHGHVVLDASFFPYDRARPHDVASCTKSLTSLAIGFLLRDGAIESLDVPLLRFFPDRSSADDSAEKHAISLAHALSMTTGFDCINEPTELTLQAMQASDDWVDFALGVPMAGTPGTSFRYCSTASHILSAIVSATSGMAEDELLDARLFSKIGVPVPDWPRDPQGITHGWGDARLYPADMLRLGQVLLDGGRYGDEQVLDQTYLELATSDRVGPLNPPNGYGYGFWTTTRAMYYARGRGGQGILVAPGRELVLVATGALTTVDEQSLFERVNHLLGTGLSDSPLAANPSAERELAALLEAIRLPPDARSVPTPPETAHEVSGQRYILADNALGWRAVRVTFAAAEAELEIELADTTTATAVGLDGVPRVARARRFSAQARHANIDIAMSGAWLDDRSFEIAFDTIDTIDAGTLRFTFQVDAVMIAVNEQTGNIQLALSGLLER
jgi:CubicO group peptidase (beta-lactamase class C family)